MKIQGTLRYSFRVGDKVRISHFRQPFDCDYDERWTGEYFVIKSRTTKESIALYQLQDIDGENIKGKLQKILVDREAVYRIEKVLRYKGNQVLVKWWGWPTIQNSLQ